MLVSVNYHYVRESYDYPYKAIFGHTPQSFKTQLEILSKQGDFVSQGMIVDHIKANKRLPEKSIVITFDDGLKEQFDIARPILERMGIPAIYFINPANIEKEEVSTVHQIHLLRSYYSPKDLLDLLNLDEYAISLSKTDREAAQKHYNYDDSESAWLKYILNFKLDAKKQKKAINKLFLALVNNPKEKAKKLYMESNELKVLASENALGSHTYHHYPIGQIGIKRASLEIQLAVKFFKNYLNYLPHSISYPYGSFEAVGNHGPRIAKNAGHTFGFTMERASNFSIKENPLMLARFDCNDVPGGKCNLFTKNGNFFNQLTDRTWHKIRK